MGGGADARTVNDAPRIGRMPACAHAWTNRAAPYSPSRSVSATAGMSSAAARATSRSGVKAPSFREKQDRTSRWTNEAAIACSVPQPFHVPAIALAIEVQIPDGAAARLDPPVLAVASVGPPLPLDPPLADHVGDLVPAPAPLERRRHPGVAFDEDLFVEALGHLVPRPVVVPVVVPVVSGLLLHRTYVRG